MMQINDFDALKIESKDWGQNFKKRQNGYKFSLNVLYESWCIQRYEWLQRVLKDSNVLDVTNQV